ncbi:MAG: adenylate kinase [Acidimicrobiales bacterium]|nr:adenylate kinase [Acidimicrobiales bacterium]
MSPVRLVIFGRQGSGKGTQCARLVEAFGPVHISTGDMLRAAVAEGTEFGRRAQKVMDAGDLVSDEIINGIVAERLALPDVVQNGFLLDGFPRTPAQATALNALLEEAETSLDLAINLDVSIEVVTERMVARGRADDSPEGIAQRLSLYEQETAPLFSLFADQGILKIVDGDGTEDEVAARLAHVVTESQGNKQ